MGLPICPRGLARDLNEYLTELVEALALLIDLVPVKLRAHFQEHLEEDIF